MLFLSEWSPEVELGGREAREEGGGRVCRVSPCSTRVMGWGLGVGVGGASGGVEGGGGGGGAGGKGGGRDRVWHETYDASRENRVPDKPQTRV